MTRLSMAKSNQCWGTGLLPEKSLGQSGKNPHYRIAVG